MQGKIFWRSKEGAPAPSSAKFSLWPFVGKRVPLAHFSLQEELPPNSPPVRVLKRTHTPDRAAWIDLVERALHQIIIGSFQKVVLARETTLHLEQAPDPFQLTASLQKKALGASLFCIQFDEQNAFFGATPERLFRMKGAKLLVEAVAGTRKRGATESENALLEKELLSSEKDLREFQFIQTYMQGLFPSLTFSPHRVHKTANVQHLFSQGSTHLALQQHPFDLVEKLYPTPALAGFPKQEALRWIALEEPFQRGLYGGIIGWEEDQDSEWMVAIRCCKLEGAVAKLYTGTGIVAGSDPSLEWEELEAKLSLYDSLFI